MSKGPGRVERAIAAIIDGAPDNAFTTEDLCHRVYQGVNRIEKKHRVAVLRAANRLTERRDTVSYIRWSTVCAYYNCLSVQSYAMARLKSDPMSGYPRRRSEADLRAQLSGRDHELVEPGGTWWHHTQDALAEIEATRAGDTKRLEKVRAEAQARNDAALAGTLDRLHNAARKAFGGEPPATEQVTLCAFCGKSEKQVSVMVTGDGAAICNQCVEISVDLIKNSSVSGGQSA